MSRQTLNQRSLLLADLHDRSLIIDTREIFLHSNFDTDSNDEEPGVDYRMALTFEKNIRFLEYLVPDKPIFIHQHCIGGEVNDGLAIYDIINASRCHITILAYAQASSMSSVILQAADLRLLMPNTELLIHYGDMSLDGVVTAILSTTARMAWFKDKLLHIYAERCQKTQIFMHKNIEEICSFLDDKITKHVDWFLSAEEAVAYGFADGIIGDSKYKHISDLI